MKQLVFSIASFFIVFFFAMSVLSISDRMTRSRKLDDALAEVMEAELKSVMEDTKYADCDSEQIEAELSSMLSDRLSETGDIEPEVKAFDAKRGLLSVVVHESFVYPNGGMGSISSEKTLLLEQEQQRRLVRVSFLLPDIIRDHSSTYTDGHERLYRQYELQVGDTVIFPEDPPKLYVPKGAAHGDDYCFAGWELVRSDGKKVTRTDGYRVGSRELSYDGNKMGEIVFMAKYVK